MADAGGALESQQAIGARIPYENIAANQKGIELAMGSFFHAADISRRRQQLEQSLQIATLKNEEQSRWHDIEMRNFENNSALKIYGMQLHEEGMQRSAEMQARGIALREDALNFKREKDEEQIGQTSDLLSSLSTMKAKPGDPDYYSKLTDIAATTPRAAASPLGRQILKQHKEDHNIAVRHAWDANNAAWRSLSYNVKREIWGGKSEDLAPLINPEMWQRQKDDKGNETGKVFIDLGPKDPVNDPHGPRSYSTLPAQRLAQLKKNYDELSRQRNSIAPQISDNDVQAQVSGSAAGRSRTDLAQEALNDPEATEKDKARARAILGYQ